MRKQNYNTGETFGQGRDLRHCPKPHHHTNRGYSWVVCRQRLSWRKTGEDYSQEGIKARTLEEFETSDTYSCLISFSYISDEWAKSTKSISKVMISLCCSCHIHSYNLKTIPILFNHKFVFITGILVSKLMIFSWHLKWASS